MKKSLYFFGEQQIIAVFLVLVGLNLSAQNIEGKTVNGAGETLSNVLIYDGIKVISQSDSLGYFSFAAAPNLKQVFFSKTGVCNN